MIWSKKKKVYGWKGYEKKLGDVGGGGCREKLKIKGY